MAGEKTEKPTQKKLRDARKKGQIPRSRDLAVAAGSLATTLALAQWGRAAVVEMGQILTTALEHFGDRATGNISEGDLAALTIRQLLDMALLTGPVMLAAAVAGVGAFALQGGVTFTTENLKPDLSKLSPARGLKRLGFSQSGLDTIKTLVVAAVIAYLSWTTVTEVMDESVTLAFLAPGPSALTVGGYMQSLLTRIGWALLLLAAADYGLQRYRSRSQLMMSKQEVRDEAKDSDGNAEVKGRVRRIQREMAKRRMLNDVSRATVVITNPTHFAVALEYRRGVMPAPKVLAKGVDEMARRIRERAQKHGVPLIENRPLARALHDGAEVGQTIPADLFSAVAEVLAQLIRLKQLWI